MALLRDVTLINRLKAVPRFTAASLKIVTAGFKTMRLVSGKYMRTKLKRKEARVIVTSLLLEKKLKCGRRGQERNVSYILAHSFP